MNLILQPTFNFIFFLELWQEWFQDELPLAVIPEQKEYLLEKFELAVKDYAC